MKYVLILMLSILLFSCTKEYSCERNCILYVPVLNDTAGLNTATNTFGYNYYTLSYHVSLAGTGNNSWGYSVPQFDTAEGILDTLEIKIFITLSCYLELTNTCGADSNYPITISRHDSLTADSIVLLSHTCNFRYGLFAAGSLSTYQDTLKVLNNVELTSMVTTQLNRFVGQKEIAFQYNPTSESDMAKAKDALDDTFRDSTFIETIYHYKTKK